MTHRCASVALIAILLLLSGCEQKSEPRVAEISLTPQAPSPGKEGQTSAAANIAAGRAKYSTFCAGCHGPKAEGIANYPKLAGQGSAIIATKLETFRAGQKIGPASASMIPIARMLTATEVQQVTDYLGSL